jgi:hypothetical protein
MDGESIIISAGWMWRCLECGSSDGTFAVEEHCRAAAHEHEKKCPNG